MYNLINNWVSNRKKNIFYLYGDTQKTIYDISELEKKYNVYELKPSDFSNKKQIIQHIEKIKKFRNLFCDNKEKMIIVKEVNVINGSLLLKIVQKQLQNEKVLVVLIDIGVSYKNLKNLTRYIDKYQVKVKKNSLSRQVVDDLLKKLDISFEVKLKNYIIKISNENVEKIQNIINFIYDKNIRRYKLDKYKEIIDTLYTSIDTNTELFNMCSDVFSKPKSMEEVMNFYNLEKVFLPLIVEYNYHSYIFKKFTKKEDIKDNLEKISDIMSKCENIHTYMFNNHFWDLNPVYAILSCYYPSVILNNKKNKNIPLKFTNIISKDSSKYIKHYHYYDILRKMKTNIFDRTLIEFNFNILLMNLLSNDTNKCIFTIQKMKRLNIDFPDIVKLLKISKNFYLQDIFDNKSSAIKKLWKKV